MNKKDIGDNMTMWEKTKIKSLQLFGSLVMEKDNIGQWKMSLARVAWWLVFIPALYIWINGRGIIDVSTGNPAIDISPNHFNILLTLTGYNFGKKINDTVQTILLEKKNSTSIPTSDEEDLKSVMKG